jgi:type IV secretory pathway TrbD component
MIVTPEGNLTPAKVGVIWVVSTSLRVSVAVVDPLMTTAMVFFVVE